MGPIDWSYSLGSRLASEHWFNRSSAEVAVDLLGCTLVRMVNGETVRGEIVETEAYEAGDPAMYAYRRQTERNSVVFGAAGVAYVYRIYRQYCCFNIVTDREGLASTVLIRAVDLQALPSWAPPPKGKRTEKLSRVAAGPGKLCRILAIDESLKGVSLGIASGLWVEARSPATTQKITANPAAITQTTRIGLSKGVDIPWRWYLSESAAVSRK